MQKTSPDVNKNTTVFPTLVLKCKPTRVSRIRKTKENLIFFCRRYPIRSLSCLFLLPTPRVGWTNSSRVKTVFGRSASNIFIYIYIYYTHSLILLSVSARCWRIRGRPAADRSKTSPPEPDRTNLKDCNSVLLSSRRRLIVFSRRVRAARPPHVPTNLPAVVPIPRAAPLPLQ